MKKIVAEIIIPLNNEKDGILAASQVKIRLNDQGGGPYLCIEGINMEDGEDSEHQFFLETVEQIDAFADICKEMLRGAENG